jgi:hypothetical protein
VSPPMRHLMLEPTPGLARGLEPQTATHSLLLSAAGAGLHPTAFEAWCASHPRAAVMLWLAADLTQPLLAEPQAQFADEAALAAYARRVAGAFEDEALGSAAPVAAWRSGPRVGACLLLPPADAAALAAAAARHNVQVLGLSPVWAGALALARARHAGLQRGGCLLVAEGTQITALRLDRVGLVDVQRHWLAGEQAASLHALVQELGAADAMVWGYGLQGEVPDALRLRSLAPLLRSAAEGVATLSAALWPAPRMDKPSARPLGSPSVNPSFNRLAQGPHPAPRSVLNGGLLSAAWLGRGRALDLAPNFWANTASKGPAAGRRVGWALAATGAVVLALAAQEAVQAVQALQALQALHTHEREGLSPSQAALAQPMQARAGNRDPTSTRPGGPAERAPAGPSANERALARLAHPWPQVFEAVEAASSQGVQWQAFEHRAAQPTGSLSGTAPRVEVALEAARRLARAPVVSEAVLTRSEARAQERVGATGPNAADAGVAFDIMLRLAAQGQP